MLQLSLKVRINKFFCYICPRFGKVLTLLRGEIRKGPVAEGLRHWSAKPVTAVRIRSGPQAIKP